MSVVGVVLATPTAALAAEPALVEIHGYEYHAPDVTIGAGESVTWTNADTARHDVASTSGPAAFASPELGEGESYTFRFTVAGGYAYLCTLHPDMTGSVTVLPAAAPATPTTTVAPAVLAEGVVAAPTTAAPTTAPLVAAVPAAVVRDDLASAGRPYVALLAVVAAVLVATVLLIGPGRREPMGGD